jgi:hypothetical protein
MRDAEDCRHPDIQRAVSSVGYDIDQPAFMAEESEESKDVDGRDKPGHDAGKREGAFAPLAPCCVRDEVDAAADRLTVAARGGDSATLSRGAATQAQPARQRRKSFAL